MVGQAQVTSRDSHEHDLTCFNGANHHNIFLFWEVHFLLLSFTSGIISVPSGHFQCPCTVSLFQNNSYESVYGLARLHANLHNYELHILLFYF